MSSQNPNDKKKENSLSERIGRSLKKYFKPIHIARPHLPNEPKTDILLVPKKTKLGVLEKKILNLFEGKKNEPLPKDQELEIKKPASLESKNPNWLDLVSYLLEVCKRAGKKMNLRAGISAYKISTNKKAQARVRTVGSIIDAQSRAINLEDEKENKAA